MMAVTVVLLLTLGLLGAAYSDCAKHPLLSPEECCHDKAPEVFYFTWETTKGNVSFVVRREWSPQGVDRFYNLLKYHYFDGQTEGFGNQNGFFRVVPGFVVQFGIAGLPAVAQAWRNLNIDDDPVKISNLPGTLCFATAGPNTRTTQMFINMGDNSRLDGMGFSPFGNITSGYRTILAITSKYGEQPNQDSIYTQGDAYLRQYFPGLDYIVRTSISLTAPQTDPDL
jgi:peptidyl-prolyl cis-trans isomerase A (cyclophilin A)